MAHTSLRYFRQILGVVSEFNISEEDCLSAVGLSKSPETERVEAQILAQILNFAADKLDDPLIGIRCALKYPILQYTRPAEFLKLCSNLKHAADVYNHYSPLFHTVGTPSGVISEDGIDRMIWIPRFDPDLAADYRQFIELIITNLVTSINWLSWKTPDAVRRVNFKHKASLPLSHYDDLFNCDMEFDQEEYSLILQDGVKDTPFAMSNQVELARVRMRFEIALNELFEKESLLDRIELQIRRSIGHGAHSKASVANALGLSERTMARALKNRGTCFKEIKVRVLKDLAVSRIHQGLPLVEIAHSLGYNDQPAFTRAYKKWFGCSPGKQNPTRNG